MQIYRINLNNNNYFDSFVSFESLRSFVSTQQIHYISEQPMQLDQKEKQTVVKKTVYARIDNLHEIINVDLHVPPLPPSDLVANDIINVTYYIHVGQLESISFPSFETNFLGWIDQFWIGR